MKKIAFLSFGLFAFVACNNTPSTSTDASAEDTAGITAVGGEKDQHGCLVGAGETWSELNQSCIQVFNVGQRLNPVEVAEGEAVISAFVLLADDGSQLELFLPGDGGAAILPKGGDETYTKDSLRYDAAAATLYINGEARYKAE